MGKQLYFVYTEDDIAQLMAYIEQIHGKFLINGTFLCEPTKMLDQIVSEMTTRSFSQYELVYAPDGLCTQQITRSRIIDGTAIEFSNCWRWSCESGTYYDDGRIYLLRTKDDLFDPHTLSLYNKLARYFKKNYIYHKQLTMYLSNSFSGQYEQKRLFVSQLGHPLQM